MTFHAREALRKTPFGRGVRFVKGMLNVLTGAVGGLYDYYTKGAITHRNWEKLLRAYCATNGRAMAPLESISRIARAPRKPEPTTGLLGRFSVEDEEKIVSAIRQDGFYVFPKRLPESFCSQIYAFAARADTVIESNRDLKESLIPFDPAHPVSRTHKIQEKDSLTNAAIQKLIADSVFLGIAETYLNTRPAIGGVDLWWSAPYGNEPGSDAAQLFHFDFDAPPVWLKLFVYVTDVGPDNGPHVYVKGSHKPGLRQSGELRARGYQRITDDEIAVKFGEAALTEITGQQGTVFMADTRGFHKGKMPTTGPRLLAQLLYCNPLFCEHGTSAKMPEQIEPALAEALAKSPDVYERFR